MKRLQVINMLLLLVVVSACRLSQAEHDGSAASVELTYAELLRLEEHEGYVTAEVTNPWDSSHVLHRYVLVPSGKPLPHSLPKGDVVRTPLKKVVVYTSVHCGLLEELGAYNNIKGVCDLQYINMPRLHKDVEKGKIKDLGESMTPNIEGIMELAPDAIMLSPFENSGSYGKLGKLGIPLIECADYMESTPLGRAEWMRFYGMLFGQTESADSLFASVERNYNALKDSLVNVGERPTVVTEMKIGSTWYVAGGKSTVAIFIKDAGGNYVFADTDAKGAVPYSPEVVFSKAKQADYWLIKYNQATDITAQDISNNWSMNKYMSAFQNGRTYVCNLSMTRFYEETPFHPDVLLREYASILHGNAVAGWTPRYYKNIKATAVE